MATEQKVEDFKKYIASKIPGFEIRLKGKHYSDDPWYRRPAEFFVKFLVPTYDYFFATTMYPFVYVPEHWLKSPNTMYGTLRHEYIHLRDEQKYGWWYKLSYILLAPILFTMRSFWERRGYTQNFIRDYERHGVVRQQTIDWAAKNFTGSNYAWMDPFFGRAKIMKIVEQVEEEEIYGLHPYEEGDWDTTE